MTVRTSRLRIGVAVLALLWAAGLGAMVGSPAAGAAPAQGAPPTDCTGYLSGDLALYLACSAGPRVEVSPATVSTCEQVTVTVDGYLPDSTAQAVLESNGTSSPLGPISVSATTANGTATFPVPGSFPLGPANAVVSGKDMFGNDITKVVPVTVTACGPDTTPAPTTIVTGTTTGGSLPVTGSDSGRLIGIGAGLIVLGAAAVYGARRSRTSA